MQTWGGHTSCDEIFSKNPWIHSPFSLERSDFKNVTFEKIPLAPFEITEVNEGCIVKDQNFETFKVKSTLLIYSATIVDFD